jgi:TPR repeat protein
MMTTVLRRPLSMIAVLALLSSATTPGLTQTGDATQDRETSTGTGAVKADESPRTLPAPQDTDSDPIGDRIRQTLQDTGTLPPKPIDMAYSAYQRGYFLTAFAMALDQAEQGDPIAQTLLGELLAKGLGVRQDFKEAAGWYKLAADQGDPEALYALGRLHMDGRGLEKDIARAAELFRQAGDLGQSTALRELGYLYLRGEGVEKDEYRAAAYLTRAATGGDSDAQFTLGGLFVEGIGVSQDDVQAARWFGEAAKAGHVPAQIEYAIMLFNGRGGPKDEPRAAGWLRQAALADNPVAQRRFARVLAEGRGVEKNAEEAARWYMIARRRGLQDKFLDIWLLRQDADILRRAEERANAWPGGFLNLQQAAARTDSTANEAN